MAESYTPEQEHDVLDSVDTKGKSQADLAKEAVARAELIVAACMRFKKPREERIQKYRNLYAGNVPKKFRQPFNVVLPTFSGILDTLMAGFNDDLALEYEAHEPADYEAIQKLNALWQQETASQTRNAKFALKCRQDRSNAMFSGRGFMVNYATSKPTYKNCFEIFEFEDAIFQPQGGGHLENHLYAGRTDIVRSAAQLESGSYDQTQVKKLLAKAARDDVYPTDENDRAFLSKFQAMGLTAADANYVGERLFKLVEIVLTLRGERWYLLFSPWYREWVRFDKNSALISSDEYHIKSWATHEDNKNFASKSYADDVYGIADATHTLINQELLNREKQNFRARAFDPSIFKDVSKLDLAQTRPDALVPAETGGGVRKISEGIFEFETARFSGTIDLINYLHAETGKDVGATDLSMGSSQQVSKKATVTLAEQQNVSKRLLLRSSSYTECMAEVGRLFFAGCKDHLPAKVALRRLGTEGEGWDATIGRADLDLYGDYDVRVKSSTQEMQNSQLKKEARMRELDAIITNEALRPYISPAWVIEEKLRSGGEYSDAEIRIAMDTKNFGNRLEVSRAHAAIQAIQSGGKPQMFYGATTLFMKIIHDFAVENRNTLGVQKYNKLLDFEMQHGEIVRDNMARKARQDAQLPAVSAPAEPDSSPAPEQQPLRADIRPAAALNREVMTQMP